MSKNNAVVLRGGLGAKTDSGLDQIAQVVPKKEKGEIHLWTPPTSSPERPSSDEDRIDGDELLKHVMGFAEKSFEWILTVARPFIREMEGKDEAFLFDLCEGGEEGETNEDRLLDYEQTISALRDFSSKNDEFLNEEEEKGGREKFLNVLCQRVRHMTEIAILVDDIRHAEDKKELESIFEKARDGHDNRSKRVFSPCAKHDAECWAFGRPYEVSQDAFGHYYGFAVEKLPEVVSVRAKELSSAFKAEVKEKQKAISAETEDVSPEELFFGDPNQVDGKRTSLSWMNRGKKNVVHVSREGDRIYIVSVFGPGPQRTFEEMREFTSKPHIPLKAILHSEDEERLCLSKGEEGMYRFGTFVKDRLVLTMCRWVRTALGATIPQRLHPDDPMRTKSSGPGGNGKPKGNFVSFPLKEDSGKKHVSEKDFFFRKNGGAGTISIVLPEGFELHLLEVLNEQMEVVAEERKVKLTSPTTVTIRRIISNGETRIVVDSCDNEEVMKELKLCGIPEIPWKDNPRTKGFQGLPLPLPSILAFGYGVAKRAGKLG